MIKKVFVFGLLAMMAIAFLNSVGHSKVDGTEKTATVKQYRGYYIYYFSEPTDEYKELGLIEKKGIVTDLST